jgi:hypothetical protein
MRRNAESIEAESAAFEVEVSDVVAVLDAVMRVVSTACRVASQVPMSRGIDHACGKPLERDGRERRRSVAASPTT